MTGNKKIEENLAKSVSMLIPEDMFDRISQKTISAGYEGTEIKMETTQKKSFRKRWFAPLAAACMLFAVGIVGVPYYSNNYVVDSIVDIDVNPSVEITANKNAKVIDVVGKNADAIKILDGMNLKNTDLKVAINAVVGSMVQQGFLVDGENGILVTVQNGDAVKANKIRNEVLSDISASLTSSNVKAAVINQTITGNSDASKFAEQNRISLGKAVFALNLAKKDSSLDAAQLAKMSLKEIAALVVQKNIDISDIADYDASDSVWENIKDTVEDINEDSGKPQAGVTAKSGEHISAEKAKEIAISDAGVSIADIPVIKVKLTYENGIRIYDVEFDCNGMEYDYELDAVTGEILSKDMDHEGHAATKPSTATAPSTAINASQAKEIALNAAGVSVADTTLIKVKLDREDGKQVYEVEFYANNIEYDFEIDAATGTIISSDTDADDKSSITAAQAKAVALSHSGISEGSATFIKVESDRDNGRLTYEVDFYSNGIEYEYTIDADTGSVLSYESEIDD